MTLEASATQVGSKKLGRPITNQIHFQREVGTNLLRVRDQSRSR